MKSDAEFNSFSLTNLIHSGSETTSYPETHDAQTVKRRCRKKAGS